MKKRRKVFWTIVLSLLLLTYVVSKVVWWYEDEKLKKVKLSELIDLIDAPELRNKEILHFSGTHEGRKWDWNVSKFIFYSEHNIEFNHMRKLILVNAEDADKHDLDLLRSGKAVIEEAAGTNIGTPKKVVSYDLIHDKNQIKVYVTETTKGFFIEAQNIEK